MAIARKLPKDSQPAGTRTQLANPVDCRPCDISAQKNAVPHYMWSVFRRWWGGELDTTGRAAGEEGVLLTISIVLPS